MASSTVIKTLKVEVRADGVLQLAGGLDKVKRSAKDTSGEIDRMNKGTAGLANNTKNFSKQAQGMGGIVRAYATVAAHVFALTAAFHILKVSADLSAMEESARQLAATTGINYAGVARSLKEISDGALTFAESMRIANLSTAAGISQSGLERLTTIGVKAATVLGRNVPDAVNRLVQAVVKGEPELVDEFGIILRLTDASEKYGESIGKAAKDLSTFEKSQAILNQVLEQGEDKYANIGAVAKPYQKLSAEFLDIGQKILSFISGPITGIVGFLADNSTLITIAIISLSSALLNLAIPAIASLGDAFQDKLATSISNSAAQIDILKKKAIDLKNSLGTSIEGEKAKSGSAIKSRLAGNPEILKFSRTGSSAIAKAVKDGLGGSEFLAAVNKSLKPYIASLRNKTKFAIENGVDTVEFRGKNISTDLARELVKGYETGTVRGQALIKESVKTGLSAAATNISIFTTRFKAAAIGMGQELSRGIQGGLAAVSFTAFRANMSAVLSSGTLTSKLAVGLGSVAYAGKAAFSAFSKLLPIAAGLTIAFEGFKFLATTVGLLTPAYDKFNTAIKESSKLLEEQEGIQKSLILARGLDNTPDDLTSQIKFIDALVNTFSTLETAADKLIEAAGAMKEMTFFDRFLSSVTGGSSLITNQLEMVEKLIAQTKAVTNIDVRVLNPELDANIKAAQEGTGSFKTFGARRDAGELTFGSKRQGFDQTRVEAEAKVNEEIYTALVKQVLILKSTMEEASKPLRMLQGNFRAMEESSKGISSNISQAALAASNISSASKTLREFDIGLAALDSIPVLDEISGTSSLTRDKAKISFLASLSTNTQRYLGVKLDEFSVESDIAKVRAEQRRLQIKETSDIVNKDKLTALGLQLTASKKLSEFEATNLDLIDARRTIERDILATKIDVATSERDYQARLVNALGDDVNKINAQKAKVAAQSESIKLLEKEKSELLGIDLAIERATATRKSGQQNSENEAEILSLNVSTLEAMNKQLSYGTANYEEQLQNISDIVTSTEGLNKQKEMAASLDLIQQQRLIDLEIIKQNKKKESGEITAYSTILLQQQAQLQQDTLSYQKLKIINENESLALQEREFEALKKTQSFRVFGSLDDNKAAIGVFGQALKKELKNFTDSMTNDIDRMVQTFTKTSDAFTDALVDGFSGDSTVMQSIKDAFIAGSETLRDTLAGFLKEDISLGMRQIASSLFNKDFSTIEEKKVTYLAEIASNTRNGGASGSEDPSKLAADNASKSASLFTQVTQKVKDAFMDVGIWLKDLFSGLWDNLGSAFKYISGLFGSSSSGGGIGGLLGTAVSAAIGVFTGGVSGALAGGITSASGATSYGLGVEAAAIEVPMFAKGGIATKPSIAGEGSMNEAVVPLPDGRTIPVNMTGSGGSVVVNINIDASGGDTTSATGDGANYEEARQLAKMISNTVKAEIMTQKRPGGLLA